MESVDTKGQLCYYYNRSLKKKMSSLEWPQHYVAEQRLGRGDKESPSSSVGLSIEQLSQGSGSG